MLLPPNPENPCCRYTLLNWACYHMFDEGIALLMLAGGYHPFLHSKIYEREKMKKSYPRSLGQSGTGIMRMHPLCMVPLC